MLNYYSDILYLPHNVLMGIKDAKWNKSIWCGLTLMKDPMSLAIYQQLIQDLKPKTILEFGSYEGGSAKWMLDIANAAGIKCKVFTFDIDAGKYACTDPAVSFVCLDADNVAAYDFGALEHPILAIEDCHVNVFGICTAVDKLLAAGDYLVVEDTLEKSKHDTLAAFLAINPQYVVDRNYCDMWGSNFSWNVNSFLKKI